MQIIHALKDILMLVFVTLSIYVGTVALIALIEINKLRSRIDRQPVEYQFVVTDSMMTVFNGDQVVGTVKIQGQLDSLLVDYNQ